METLRRAGATSAPVAPALLVSLHDVSPLTLDGCVSAAELLLSVGISPKDLTLFVIPRHDDRIPVDEHPPTVSFLRTLTGQGACLVMHGLTHRMKGRAWSPSGFVRGHVFARGQGELLLSDAPDTWRRLETGAAILKRAGFDAASRAFIPPAWLLSPAARDVVSQAGFEFYETFRGIVHAGTVRARRVIGWGSLSALEAHLTAVYARLQCLLPPADTRLAVHPADMGRPRQRRAIAAAVRGLRRRMQPMSYAAFLAERVAPAKSPR